MKISLYKGLVKISFFFVFLQFKAYAFVADGNLQKVGPSEQLSLKGLQDWNYSFEILPGNRVSLRLQNTISSALEKKLKKWKGKHIKSIEVKKEEMRTEINLKLSKGVSSFDYLTDQPSQLVIDFFSNIKKKTLSKQKKESKKTQRKPASEFIKFDSNSENQFGDNNKKTKDGMNDYVRKGVFDAGDPEYKRFKIKPSEINTSKIKENLSKNIFLNFPILIDSSNRLDEILKDNPIYIINPKNKKETKLAKLLHKLYEANSFAAYDKLYNHFNIKYPKSKYKNILRSLSTSVYFNAWKKTGHKKFLNKSEENLLKFKKDLGDHPATEHWTKVLFYSYLNLEQGLKAAELGEYFLKKYPNSKDFEHIKLGLAESYLISNNFDIAEDKYNELIRTTDDEEIKKIARLVIPVISLKKNKAKQALNKYFKLEKSIKGKKTPSYFFNIAETLFWQGEYLKSAEYFRMFVKKFPKNLNSSYAITRIAEIMQLAGFAKERVEPIFFESAYRFEGLKGADIAQIRLNSSSWKSKKEKEIANNIKEINDITKKYNSEKFNYFRDIILADAFSRKGKYEESNVYLEDTYRKKPFSSVAKGLKNRIIKNLKGSIQKHLSDKDYLKAIGVFEKNRLTWLSNFEDPDFKRDLAISFEMAGLNDYALANYMDYVSDKNKRGEKIEFPVIVSLAELNQKNKNYGEMDKYLTLLTEYDRLPDQDKFKIVNLKFKVFKEKSRFKEAEELINNYMQSEKTELNQKIKSTLILSKLLDERAKYKDSMDVLTKMLSKVTEKRKEFFQFRKQLVISYLKNGKDQEALREIEELMKHKKFSEDESFMYLSGNLLIKEGLLKKGNQVLSMLKSKNSFYENIVSEKINHKNWQNKYSEIVNRIPAMEKVEEGEL